MQAIRTALPYAVKYYAGRVFGVRRSTHSSELPVEERNAQTYGDKLITDNSPEIIAEIKEAVGSRQGDVESAEDRLTHQKKLLQTMAVPYPVQLAMPLEASGVEHFPLLKPEEAFERLKKAKIVALGDLHASPHKLIEALVMSNMLRMPTHHMKELISLIPKAGHELTDEQLINTYSQIKPLIRTMQWVGDKRQMVLIGDVLSDRGPLDTVTLDIIEHLSRNAPDRFIRIASNHDLNVSYHYNGTTSLLDPDFIYTHSLHNSVRLAKALDKVKGNNSNDYQDKLRKQYQDYLSRSVLLHQDSATGTMFLHAPVSETDFQNFADDLKAMFPRFQILPFSKWSQANLPKTMNLTNRILQKMLKQSLDGKPSPQKAKVLQGSPFHTIVWERSSLENPEDRPFNFQQHGVPVTVHGHDASDPFLLPGDKPTSVIVNLDDLVRKNKTISPDKPLSLYAIP